MWRTFKNAESRKIRCLFKRVLGAVPRSSIHYKFRQSSIQKEHDCFFLSISLGYPLKMTKRRKIDFVLKNCCEISRDNNHQSLYKSIKLYNDIELDPGPVYVNELPLSLLLRVHQVLLPPGKGFSVTKK